MNTDRLTFQSAEREAVATVREDANGDLVIEGFAAVFTGIDRTGEQFAAGAFQRAIDRFLAGSAALAFHHKHDRILGRVLHLEERPEGLWMRARVDAAVRRHPELGVYFDQIRSGTLNSLSVGGIFRRAVVGGLRKITGVDLTEISVVGVPAMGVGTSFAVVAGKALADPIDSAAELDMLTARLAVVRTQLAVERLAVLDARMMLAA